ncbi:hypothetical protein A2797_00560 [candidate division WWE3 bacterium RIFCSPHIGHO2_01_FULL_48_15]|uniref:Uncharacterized protein n=1 Tax=candidate division WWE3 bacterium RIFCSPHIGHO2_01_FULL_48_15 TaxID=1802619 RepID=A0A1F4VBY2_UNCKA|nr:MAG: hypothetical protein A2797_00560 [candidate division WWE3 bacterium RIFCSPHIGHO2_01_FULL_48_15]
MFKFSILSAFRRKLVSLLAIVGVGLGSGLLVALLSLSSGIAGRFDTTFQSVSGTISVSAKGGSSFGRFLGATGDPLPASYAQQIEELEGISLTAPFVSAPVRSEKFGLLGQRGIGITGVIKGDDLFGFPNAHITQGRPFEKSGEVIAGSEIFAVGSFSNLDLKIGDEIVVPTGKPQEFVTLTLVGIFETGDQLNDQGLFASVQTVREISGLGEGEINGILVQAENPENVDEIAKNIENLFSSAAPAVSTSIPGNLFESLGSFLDLLTIFLLAIALVAAAAGGTAVMVVMLLTVFERRREFGILKAAGWSNFNIISSVLITSLTLSILGVIFGLSLGSGVALAIKTVSNLEIVAFGWQMFAWAGGVGLVTGLIGGLIPALSAARVSPIETLRGE